MSAEQEAQQAQTIAHIRKNQNTGNDLCREDDFIAALLKIVDSQAQKIAELSALFQKAGNGAVDLAMKCAEHEKTINEQADEIERLKGEINANRRTTTN